MKNLVFGALGLAGLTAIGLAGLLGLAYRDTERRLSKVWDVGTPDVEVSADTEMVARGRHLVHDVLLCAGCHDSDLGGKQPFIDLAGVAVVNSPNITPGPGTVVADYAPEDFGRLVRFGVRPDGTAVAGMPVQNFTGISDADLDAVVSYLVQVEPVDRDSAPSEFATIGRVSWYLGLFDLQFTNLVDLEMARPEVTPTEPVELGEYLFHLGGCADCHGATGSGGKQPLAPSDMAVPRNLTPHETGLKTWTRTDFNRAVRGGMSKDGSTLDQQMPWPRFAGMDEAEIDALWAYLQTLEPLEFGNR